MALKLSKEDGRKKNLLKVKVDGLSEKDFNRVVSEASSEYFKKTKIVVKEHDNLGVAVKCGPLLTCISKSKKTVKLSIDGGVSFLDYFSLYVRPGEYRNDFIAYARKIIDKKMQESQWYKDTFDENGEEKSETVEIDFEDKDDEGKIAVKHKGLINYIEEKVAKSYSKFSLSRHIERDARESYNKMIGRIAHANTFLTASKSKTFQDAMRKYMHVVWMHLDKEALAILNKVQGYGSGSIHYNLVMHNKKDAVTLFKHTPSVLPLFFYLHSHRSRGESSNPYFTNFNKVRIPLEKPQGIIPFVRESAPLLKKKRVWKWVCKLKPRWMAAYTSRMYRRHNMGLYMMSLWAEAGIMPKYTTFIEMASDFSNLEMYCIRNQVKEICEDPSATHSHQEKIDKFVWFLRKMSEESLKHPAKTFYNQYASLAKDWLVDNHGDLTKQIMKQASWGWIMREQEDWHANRFTARYRNDRTLSWSSLIDEVKLGDYKFVALNSSQELAGESAKMGHCVASYDRYCDSGSSRIFSIRKGKTNLATLEIKNIVNSDGFTIWREAQLRGPKNKNVDRDIIQKSKSLVRQYQKKQKELDEASKSKKKKVA